MGAGRRNIIGAMVLASLLVITGCSASDDGGQQGGQGATGKPAGSTPSAPAAKLVADPAVDAKEVPVLQPVKIAVSDGKLTDVALTDPDGKQIAGETTADKLSWANTERLAYGKTYTYTAKAVGAGNKPAELKGTFTTMTPGKTIRATVNPADGQTVGVGMPISVNFPDTAPKDRAAAERALKIETTPKVEGSWAWVSASKVDWRPKEYWPAGTKIKVSASLYGVNYGNGYGKADVTSEFTIGRKQVLKVHTPDHNLKVYRNGSLVATYPSSNGKDADPKLNTPNGTLIVMSKERVGDFSNPDYGYTNVKKNWAMRISNHGEYLHENEDNRANIGKANTSHGCVNLLDKDAKALFDSSLIGDPVEISGSKVGMPATSEVNDWLFSWEKWTGMSALK